MNMHLSLAALGIAAAAALGGIAHADNVPGGSYLHSCRNIVIQEGTQPLLLADCPNRQGQWQSTGLRYRTCPGDITNLNGRLSCAGNGSNRYGGRLRLYNEFSLRGAYIDIGREVTNMPKARNDRGRSLKVTGGGLWQVCSDSDFKGHCETVSGTVPDLRSIGLADTISSVRQIQ